MDLDALRREVYAYLDRRAQADSNADQLFFWIGDIALPRHGTPVEATGSWEQILGFVHDWEAMSGRRVHKGGGYYLAAVRDIALWRHRRVVYMHQAVYEDQRTYQQAQGPALWFVTLNGDPRNQAYRQRVLVYEQALQGYLVDYVSRGRGQLTLADLRGRVERYPNQLLDPLMALTHSVARTLRLGDERIKPLRGTQFSELLLSQVALELCLTAEELMRLKVTLPPRPGRPLRRS